MLPHALMLATAVITRGPADPVEPVGGEVWHPPNPTTSDPTVRPRPGVAVGAWDGLLSWTVGAPQPLRC